MATLTISAEDEKKVKARGFLSNKGTDNFSGRIITINGKITAEQQKVIGEAAEKFGNGIVTFTTRLTIEVQGIPYDKIDDFCAYIAKAGLVTGGTGSKVRPVVACKGTTCQYGLLDSFELSEKIHHRFYASPQVQNRRGRMPQQLREAGSQRSGYYRTADSQLRRGRLQRLQEMCS